MGILNSWIVELISWENHENPSIPWWLWGVPPFMETFVCNCDTMYIENNKRIDGQYAQTLYCTLYITFHILCICIHDITLHTHENNVHIILYHDKANRYTMLWSYPPFIWNTPQGTMAYITQNEIAYEWDHRKEVWNFGGKGKYTPG